MNKPEVSVVIPNKDDDSLLPEVIRRLNNGVKESRFEVIIVDDGSFNPVRAETFADYTNVKIIYNKVNKGVGYSFDMGVKNALADNILLLGSDVFVKDKDWIKDVKRNATDYPKAFTCATCVGINPDNMMDRDWSERTRRYGANIVFKMTLDDVPKNSPLQKKKEWADITQCKWIRVKISEESYEIPGILGTCYAVSRRWYLHIGGWGWIKETHGLSKEEMKWIGFRVWGNLEPMISFKSWFAGGSCRVDPRWETAHVFSRPVNRAVRLDMMYWNRLFALYTLFPEEQAKALDNHLLKGKNENEARKRIKQNKNAVMAEKRYNDANKVYGAEVFAYKFGYKLDWLLNLDK